MTESTDNRGSNHLLENEPINPYSNTPILLLAGGFGTRMKESENRRLKTRPKSLVSPQGRETLIDIALGNLYRNNFKNEYLLIATGQDTQEERIERYVKRGIGPKLEKKGVNINFSREETPLGTAGASYKAITEFKLTGNVVITPTDTAFPFSELQQAIKIHKNRDSYITWLVTSNPGDNTQNVGKLLVDSENENLQFNFESRKSENNSVELNDKLVSRTSVGVFVVSAEYFIEKYKQMIAALPELSNKPVDLYRNFASWLLDEGEIINTHDIKQPAPDLGTESRLRTFSSR